MTEETITITVKEYDQLCDDSALLSFLQNHGVDNWCGWDDARTDYWAWKGDDE